MSRLGYKRACGYPHQMIPSSVSRVDIALWGYAIRRYRSEAMV